MDANDQQAPSPDEDPTPQPEPQPAPTGPAKPSRLPNYERVCSCDPVVGQRCYPGRPHPCCAECDKPLRLTGYVEGPTI